MPPASRATPDVRRLCALLFAIALGTIALNAILFWTPLYRSVIAPDSSAGSLLNTVSHLRAQTFARNRDVLVFGDSRMFRGFDTGVAGRAEPHLRFFNAAVPGTTPRCWPYLARSADPAANDLAAVVIPVDSYADLDTSLGALDADAHLYDLHYLAVSSGLADIPAIAASFPGPDRKAEVALNLALRGPLLAEDAQSLLADPAGRVAALDAATHGDDPTRVGHAALLTLLGLRLNAARTSVIGVPPFLDHVEAKEIADTEIIDPKPSPSWGEYRFRWLGLLAARYRAAGVPIVFVRVPPRPIPLPDEAYDGPGASTSIGRLVALGGAVALPAAPYVALQRPENFSDHDHLSEPGSLAFSTRLAHDVASAIQRLRTNANSGSGAARMIGALRSSRVTSNSRAGSDGFSNASVFGAIAGFGNPMRLGTLEYSIFVIVVLAIWNVRGVRIARHLALLGASYYFYARWNAAYLAFLVALTLSDYAIALAIERARNAANLARAWLACGVAANLAFLGVLKYTDFLGASLGALRGGTPLWTLHLLVPIGISFHTFQSISYLIDVRRGTIPARRNLLDYALYLAFFPQLLAGPIVRAGVFLRELDLGPAPNADDIARGLTEIARGLFKKFAIADQLAPYADAYFSHVADHTNIESAWAGTLAFAFQIYFDFSGYSDIAIGTARLFGFAFPENFRRPYFASGASDFWRRWHISLSSWLRDYLYIPLGGNRHGLAATLRNLMITMVLGGLWHGAGWTFVAWGAYHGLWLSLERLWNARRANRVRAVNGSGGENSGLEGSEIADSKFPNSLPRVARALIASTIVIFGWVLFRAPSLGEAWTAWLAMFGRFPDTDWSPVIVPAWMFALAGIALVCELVAEAGVRAPPLARLQPRHALAIVACAAIGLVGLELLWAPAEQTFVYFKF